MHRVAFLSDHSDPLAMLGGPEAGGQNVYVRELGRALTSCGWEVDVFTQGTRDDRVEIDPGMTVHRLATGFPSQLDKHSLAEHAGSLLRKLVERIERLRLAYDVVHGHYYVSGWLGAQLKARLPVVMVQTFHSLGRARVSALGPSATGSRHRLLMERVSCQTADLIVTNSARERSWLEGSYGVPLEKIEIAPGGVDEKQFAPGDSRAAKRTLGLDSESNVILSVGRLVPQKGLPTLIAAAHHLVRAVPEIPVTVVIVGGPASEEGKTSEAITLRTRADDLDLREVVNLVGPRQHDVLRTYYQAADIFVLPSLYEPFGLAGLEALSCGTPLVVSAECGVAELVRDGDTGFLFPPGDDAQLTRKLRLLLEHSELRRAMGRRGVRVAVPACTWSSLARRVAQLYLSAGARAAPDLLAGSPSRS